MAAFGVVGILIVAAVTAVAVSKQQKAQNRVLEQQADAAEARARQERTLGVERGNAVRRAKIDALRSAAAHGAASGIELNAGPTGAIFQEILSDAERQQKIVRSNAQIGALAEKLQARNLRRQKQSPAIAGLIAGIGTASSLSSSVNLGGSGGTAAGGSAGA